MLGPGIFFKLCQIRVHAYPESKCLPGEHKRTVSTFWGLGFFLNHDKYEHMPTRRAQAPGEYMLGPMIFFNDAK